jgi:hypothetical protein
MGVPAKPVRKMSQEELDDIARNATEYLDLWHRDYRGQVLHSDISPGPPPGPPGKM